jgi:hypothetical protein
MSSFVKVVNLEIVHWAAAGSEDTELGVLMEPGAGHSPSLISHGSKPPANLLHGYGSELAGVRG